MNVLFTATVRAYFYGMPDSIYNDDHIVFDDVDTMNNFVQQINNYNSPTLKVIRTEQSVFKNHRLSRKRTITDYLKLEKLELQQDEDD